MSEIKINKKLVNATNNSKIKKARLHHSNYYITINTNQRFTGHEEEFNLFVENFQNTIDNVLMSNDGLKQIIKFKDPSANFTTQFIDSINPEGVVEKSPNNNTIHAHILLKISHRTLISLDYDLIKQKIQEEMNLKNIYMSVRVYRSSTDQLEDYLKKNQK